jgi:hypothetical protein
MEPPIPHLTFDDRATATANMARLQRSVANVNEGKGHLI